MLIFIHTCSFYFIMQEKNKHKKTEKEVCKNVAKATKSKWKDYRRSFKKCFPGPLAFYKVFLTEKS